jgi:hypothetical protein
MIITHLALGCARTIALKCNGHVPRVWNIQMVNTTTMQYDNVSFHVRVVDKVPQFLTIAKNITYGMTTKTTYQNKFVHANKKDIQYLKGIEIFL